VIVQLPGVYGVAAVATAGDRAGFHGVGNLHLPVGDQPRHSPFFAGPVRLKSIAEALPGTLVRQERALKYIASDASIPGVETSGRPNHFAAEILKGLSIYTIARKLGAVAGFYCDCLSIFRIQERLWT